MAATILIVDDEKDIRISLQGILEDEGYQVLTASDGEDALTTIRAELPDLVLLDIWMPGMDGMETLSLLKDEFPFLTTVMISGHGTIETAVKATKLGAYDFIEKPLSLDKVLITVANALKLKQLSLENSQLKQHACRQHELVGATAAIVQLREQALRVAASASPLLISGEKGSGKCLLAGFIHYQSARREQPFSTILCAALPEDLLERELFGYEKGAFPTASASGKGVFDRVDGGTLLLDEISELPRSVQSKVLRVMREGCFERAGGGKSVRVSVRVIASSSVDLQQKRHSGEFLEELYRQLTVVSLAMPPLRERLADLPLLVQHLICQFSRHEGRDSKTIEPAALEMLQSYRWPGNIRELRNMVERILIMSTGAVITVDDIPELRSEGDVLLPHASGGATLRSAREEFEREFILRKLEEHDWNISRTAELIGVERTSLHRKIKSYGIDVHK